MTKYLWPEIHKWARKLNWEKIGRSPFTAQELLTLSLKLGHGEAFAVASNNFELIEGAHADSLLYLLDEAKAIPDPTWDAVEGAFSGGGTDTGNEAFALAISTPGEPIGRFFDIHRRKPGFEDWWVRHVTKDEAIAAKRISAEWAEQRRKQWGEKSALYQNRVEGDFAASEQDSVIPLTWIELANERWEQRQERIAAGEALPALTHIGVDVAAGGKDKSVIARRHGLHISELHKYDYADTMETTGMAAGVMRGNSECHAVVDVIGWGAGCCHRLRELFPGRVSAFVAGAHTDGQDRNGEMGFVNKRSEAWWQMRELLDPQFGAEIELPPDDELTGDLTAPKWRPVSGGKIQVESKDELRKPERLGRSTDVGDAVIQACYGARITMHHLAWEDDAMKPSHDKEQYRRDLDKSRDGQQLKAAMPEVDNRPPPGVVCGNCIWHEVSKDGKPWCGARLFTIRDADPGCENHDMVIGG